MKLVQETACITIKLNLVYFRCFCRCLKSNPVCFFRPPSPPPPSFAAPYLASQCPSSTLSNLLLLFSHTLSTHPGRPFELQHNQTFLFREVEPLVPLINQHGEQLFMAVIRCVGGAASRSYIDYFTDILLALNKKYFDNLCRQVFLATLAS